MKETFLKIIVNRVFTSGGLEMSSLEALAEECKLAHEAEIARRLNNAGIPLHEVEI